MIPKANPLREVGAGTPGPTPSANQLGFVSAVRWAESPGRAS
jgi:hypothetical protein